MITKTKRALLAAVAAACGFPLASVSGQNAFHAPSDLVLTFQNPGGAQGSDQTVTVALANVSTFFRDAEPNSFTLLNAANIGGLGATLTSTFGANWFDQSTLWMGGIGFRGTSPTATQLLNGDPHQTFYFTKGYENPAPTIIANSGSRISSAMGQVKGTIEDFGTTAVFVRPTSTSFVDEQNPFTVPGVQNAAYGDISGGVQGSFAQGTFGSLGAAGDVELALDLFRLQTRNDITGQYGFGEEMNTGALLGTLTINQAGEIGFLAVPEPSTAGMLAVASVAAFTRRRKRRA